MYWMPIVKDDDDVYSVRYGHFLREGFSMPHNRKLPLRK
jgi:hypothetical protein